MVNNRNKIGVMIVGLNGCVGNSTVVGHRLISCDNFPKFGMLTDLDFFEALPLPAISDIFFSGWDIRQGNAHEAAITHNIIPANYFESHKEYLLSITPYRGITTKYDSLEIINNYSERSLSMQEAVSTIIADINDFRRQNDISQVIVMYVGSPTRDCFISETHHSLSKFEKAISENSDEITTGMLYCYAALQAKCPFVDFTPNPTLEATSLIRLAEDLNLPIVGRDGSTGQTLIKCVIAEMLSIRNFRLTGWYSTNILGNNDGYVLTQPGFSKSKIEDKLGVLSPILGYDDFDHKVSITYYKPRGDNKESWDNVDFQGFLGMEMSFNINWRGRDSILAAPLLIDLIRFVSLAQANNEKGLLDYLALYFKNPIGVKEKGFFKNWARLCGHFTKV